MGVWSKTKLKSSRFVDHVRTPELSRGLGFVWNKLCGKGKSKRWQPSTELATSSNLPSECWFERVPTSQSNSMNPNWVCMSFVSGPPNWRNGFPHNTLATKSLKNLTDLLSGLGFGALLMANVWGMFGMLTSGERGSCCEVLRMSWFAFF